MLRYFVFQVGSFTLQSGVYNVTLHLIHYSQSLTCSSSDFLIMLQNNYVLYNSLCFLPLR